MKNYLITPKGEVKDLGIPQSHRPITSAAGVRPVTFGDLELVPPKQPLSGLVVQQVDPPTPEQIAVVVRKAKTPTLLAHWRVRRILIKHDLLDALLTYVDNMTDADAKTTITCAWEGGADVLRYGPTVLGAQIAFGLTDEQVDNMFIEGSELTV